MKNSLAHRLFEAYPDWVESTFQQKRFGLSTIKPLIETFSTVDHFQVKQAGYSEEHRAIYEIQYGTGPIKLFIWSQMHGDEATGTMAVFDLLNFLRQLDKQFPEFEDLKNQVSLHIIPMLNPDGASRFSRYNAMGIDLNRDAHRQQSKEAQLLWERVKAINPDYCFTLHDQDPYYSTGRNRNIASMSFLANPVDYENSVPAHRKAAKQLIVQMNEALQQFIPNQVGRYVDLNAYDPSSFGDSFQREGYATLLFEAGGYRNDLERMQPRKLTFIGLVIGIQSIMTSSYKQMAVEAYEDIPNNKNRLYHLILWNLSYKKGEREITIDIGINRIEKDEKGEVYFKGELINFGDLQNHNAYEEYDCSGMEIRTGGVIHYNGNIEHTNFSRFHQQGITTLIHPFKAQHPFVSAPINLTNKKNYAAPKVLDRDMQADFAIWQDNQVKYLILNGFLRDMGIEQGRIRNGMWVN